MISRNKRRAKAKAVFDEEMGALLDIKSNADLCVDMPPPKRKQIVPAEDAEHVPAAKAIMNLANYDFATKQLLKQQNIVELQGSEVIIIQIAVDINASMATIQAEFQEKVDARQEIEDVEAREHNAIIRKLEERIEELTQIDAEIRVMESLVEDLVEEENWRGEELRVATEARMEVQLQLREKKIVGAASLKILMKNFLRLARNLHLAT